MFLMGKLISYRRLGIGKELINKILYSNRQVTYILRGDIENKRFYKEIGFEEVQLTLIYKRKV